MNITILLYENFTALDAIGPYEVLRSIPNAKVKFVARERGGVLTDSKALTINADYALAEISSTDILVVPGSSNPIAALQDPAILKWVAEIHATTKWTLSVCTGSLILGAAGLLNGLSATTHWAAMEILTQYGAKPVSERYIREGKIVTAAGVSAGIDMALEVVAIECGEDIARMVQLGIEYDPKPPFDAGSPAKSSPQAVEMLRGFFKSQMKN